MEKGRALQHFLYNAVFQNKSFSAAKFAMGRLQVGKSAPFLTESTVAHRKTL